MRRRNVGVSEAEQSSARKVIASLKHLDVYNKVHEDFVQKSQAGGAVTIVTSFLVVLLFWAELTEFFRIEVDHSISVDTRLKQKLRIGLNVTFPHLRCDEVSVDTVDSAGDNQINLQGGLEKFNLDPNGQVIPGDPLPAAGECLPCLEAADETHKCCNSCQDLKDAYADKELSYFHILDTAVQCSSSPGCRVSGKVVVNKVSGNVHVALGRSRLRDGKLVHEFNLRDVSDGFNTSHTIHSITFGDSVPGVFSPLDGTTKTVMHGTYMFHYYVKLVPTVFTDQWGSEAYTHQYSVTDTARNVQVRSGELTGLPGVFIVYDFSPFLMRKSQKAKPWSSIFTSSCAIIGGVLSIATFVEMCLSSFLGRLCTCHPGVIAKV